MRLLNRIEATIKLWEIVLPHFPAPPDTWIGHLCTYPDEAIEEGIVRASKRFSPDRIDEYVTPEDVWRYASATARQATEKQAEKKENVTA